MAQAGDFPEGAPPEPAAQPKPAPDGHRVARRHHSPEDQRRPYQKDRDRILYTEALRRLAGVTQVVSPAEGHVFHNRLTHTLEVAQIARRLAENLLRTQPALADAHGGLDADVVESAALAPDLGHPQALSLYHRMTGHISGSVLDPIIR
jgi:dGTP triphosphohydrolase